MDFQKVAEITGAYLLVSLLIMLSVNYALAPTFISAVLATPRMSYVQAVVVYGLSNLLFKNNSYMAGQ